MLRTHPDDLACYMNKVKHLEGEECCLVVDAGFSFTHLVPFIEDNDIIRD